jgi:hypothetical protein
MEGVGHELGVGEDPIQNVGNKQDLLPLSQILEKGPKSIEHRGASDSQENYKGTVRMELGNDLVQILDHLVRRDLAQALGGAHARIHRVMVGLVPLRV